MNKIATLSSTQRKELFAETAIQMNAPSAIAEKDFWVCWVLDKLFTAPTISKSILFKGGTSLSKVFGVIERFSEDIDLILDWNLLTDIDPNETRSKTAQSKLNVQINKYAVEYIKNNILPEITSEMEGICTATIDPLDPHIINIGYPASFDDGYLRPEIRLEIGPLAAWLPYDTFSIKPYAAEKFPALFQKQDCTVLAIKAERTFWEKVTILHQEAFRPEDKPQPLRYSRHYYDLAMMSMSEIKEAAMLDLELLKHVVEFKKRFYPRAWARYDLAVPGSIKLIPSDHVLKNLKTDYEAMQTMIFGAYPTFETIIGELQTLEQEINCR